MHPVRSIIGMDANLTQSRHVDARLDIVPCALGAFHVVILLHDCHAPAHVHVVDPKSSDGNTVIPVQFLHEAAIELTTGKLVALNVVIDVHPYQASTTVVAELKSNAGNDVRPVQLLQA